MADTTRKLFVQISVSTVVGLKTALTNAGVAIPPGAAAVYIQPDGGDIRLRNDATDPTASVGMHLYDGVAWPLSGDLNDDTRFVAVTGTVLVNLMFMG